MPAFGFGPDRRGRFPRAERHTPEPESSAPEDADCGRQPGQSRLAELSCRVNHNRHDAIVMPRIDGAPWGYGSRDLTEMTNRAFEAVSNSTRFPGKSVVVSAYRPGIGRE
jgi:hypothetical protein